ncbi:MAG: hypothetical protein GX096_01955 [Clostridiales bacterium]|nr:hypothetical protein [Clostridiales bacterium]
MNDPENETEQTDHAIEVSFMKWLPSVSTSYKVLIYIGTIVLAALSILVAVMDIFPPIAEIILYVCAAASLLFTCCYGMKDALSLSRNVVKPRIASNPFTHRLSSDYQYRTILFAISGFTLNLIFAGFNCIIAIISSSGWYGSLAAYYLLLVTMRWGAVGHVRTASKQSNREAHEMQVYLRCGYLFILMSLVLGGVVFWMTRGKSNRTYPGILIYAVAVYTFWKVAISIVNLVKVSKTHSILLKALRNIGYADALVSLLSLQTALLAEFSEGDITFSRPMNTATGIVVCTLILIMGIHTVQRARTFIKQS